MSLLTAGTSQQLAGGVLTDATLSNINADLLGLSNGTAIVPGSIGQSAIDASIIQHVKIPVTTVTAAAVIAMFTTGIPLVAAQGAGTLIEVVSIFFDGIFGSAAFTGGGAIAAYYGTNHTGVLASATIPAAFLTTFSANQGALVAGAIASSTAMAGILNTGLVLSNATGVFAAGTGCTGILTVVYRVHVGLS